MSVSIYNSSDTFVSSHATISDAIANWTAGDRIEVGPGTYKEQVRIISKDGIIIEGVGDPVIEAPDNPVAAAGNADAVAVVEMLLSDHVTFTGFIIDGDSLTTKPDPNAGTNLWAGIYMENSTGLLSDLSIRDIVRFEAGNVIGETNAHAIFASDPAIDNNFFDGVDTVIDRSLTIQNSEFLGFSGAFGQSEVSIHNGLVVTITDNHFQGSGVEGFDQALLYLRNLNEGGQSTVSGNLFDFFASLESYSSTPSSFPGNFSSGIFADSSSVRIQNNEFDPDARADHATHAITLIGGAAGGIDILQNQFGPHLGTGIFQFSTSEEVAIYDNVSGLANNYDAGMIFGVRQFVAPGGTESLLLRGSPNTDFFETADGNDTIFGYAGNDSIKGAGGNDRLYGGDGLDELHGGPGNDLLIGDDGNDDLFGNDGADRLLGSDGDDNLNGHDGDDTMIGGRGADDMFGGAGNDRLYADGADFNIFGGTGTDRLIGQGTVGLTIDMGQRSFEAAFGTSGDDSFDGSGLGLRTVLIGKDGNDTLIGGAGNDLLEGRNDDDVIRGHSGDDYITGGNGNDDVRGDYEGAPGGTEGNDTVFGGAGDDVVYGGGGNDRLYGDAGFDQLRAGDGDDLLFIDDDDTFIDGGSGFDSVYMTGASGFFFLVGSTIERVFGTGGNDTISGGLHPGQLALYGNGGDDLLIGSNNALGDLLIGGDGDDTIRANGGDDALNGGAGTDTAIFTGNQADYDVNIISVGTSARITHLTSGDVNTLSLMEFAQFDDGTIGI